jgi:hypothetical protein
MGERESALVRLLGAFEGPLLPGRRLAHVT